MTRVTGGYADCFLLFRSAENPLARAAPGPPLPDRLDGGRMALRAYTDRDGQSWSVWLVRPIASDTSPLPPRYREGWICFERKDGTGRCRLPIDQAPAEWASLADERLDLLRRVAEQPVHTGERLNTGVEGGHGRTEDEQRLDSPKRREALRSAE